MTDKQTLLDLAEQCEAATGKEQERLKLNGDIALAIGHPDTQGCHIPSMKRGGDWAKDRWFGNAGTLQYQAPNYTASLDAAMTLVPEGWRWTNGDAFAGKGAVAHLWHGDLTSDVVRAATPALALCAAALRARAAMAED